MRPEDVPDHILETALRAAWENETGGKWSDRSGVAPIVQNDFRVGLAAALPEYAAEAEKEIKRLNDLLDEFEEERERLKNDLGILTDAIISHEYGRRKGLTNAAGGEQVTPENASVLEFVVFDKDGNEIDSVDPYHGHEAQADQGYYVVRGQHNGEYSVYVPDGGSYEIRPRESL